MAMGKGGKLMWVYEKKLQYPVKIHNPNPKLAQFIITQIGGPDGEQSASMHYMNQRYAMKQGKVRGVLTDIATEELGHLEIVSAIVYQLTRNLTPEEILESGFDTYFVDHTLGIYPVSSSGTPFTAAYFQSKGDPITDLTEDLAAEQKARSTYDNILRLCSDPEVRDPIKFLRQREIVHFQRFGEALRAVQDDLNAKNFYCCNPSYDKNCGKKNHTINQSPQFLPQQNVR
jgi:spore coat protein JC